MIEKEKTEEVSGVLGEPRKKVSQGESDHRVRCSCRGLRSDIGRSSVGSFVTGAVSVDGCRRNLIGGP